MATAINERRCHAIPKHHEMNDMMAETQLQHCHTAAGGLEYFHNVRLK